MPNVNFSSLNPLDHFGIMNFIHDILIVGAGLAVPDPLEVHRGLPQGDSRHPTDRPDQKAYL